MGVGRSGVRQKPKLPRGLSWPLSAKEVEQRFPEAASVRWERSTLHHDGPIIVLRGSWNPTSQMPQPVLTIRSVPSQDRHAIHTELSAVLGEEAARWFADVEGRPETWRSEQQYVQWEWSPPLDTSTG
jgi:hypothetical protein